MRISAAASAKGAASSRVSRTAAITRVIGLGRRGLLGHPASMASPPDALRWAHDDVQPELWVDRAGAAVDFYQAAFGAVVLHRVGEGDDLVVQLAAGDAAFWVVSADAGRGRFSPKEIGGATSRSCSSSTTPTPWWRRAARAGTTVTSEPGDEHGWRLGRIVDPFGHEWEIGRPLGVVAAWLTRLRPGCPQAASAPVRGRRRPYLPGFARGG